MQSRLLYAVIHLIDQPLTHTLEQVNKAFANDADGILLISAVGNMSGQELLDIYHFVRQHFPNEIIGLNFMINIKEAAQLVPADCQVLWTDDGIGVINDEEDLLIAKYILSERNYQGRLFAGFYFKGNNYKLPEEDPLIVCQQGELVCSLCDVPTTSGPATAVEVSQDNLLKLRQAIPIDKPLAIASGVNIDNVHRLLPYINYFIIGTGIEEDEGDPAVCAFYREAGLFVAPKIGFIDHEKVAALATVIHSYIPS
jgi:hypothetical protein